MTHAFLILWAATGQIADKCPTVPAMCAALATCPVPTPVIVHSGDDRAQQAQLEELRDQLSRAREQASMPDHAVAALMVSGHPELTSLVRRSQRRADRGAQKAEIEVFVSPHEGASLVAVIVNLKNPRDAKTWEPTEALVKIEPQPEWRLGEPVRWGPPIPAAVRSVPARIVPGQSARIVVVFEERDVGLDRGPVVVELLREGTWEFDFTLRPSDLAPSSRTEGPL